MNPLLSLAVSMIVCVLVLFFSLVCGREVKDATGSLLLPRGGMNQEVAATARQNKGKEKQIGVRVFGEGSNTARLTNSDPPFREKKIGSESDMPSDQQACTWKARTALRTRSPLTSVHLCLTPFCFSVEVKAVCWVVARHYTPSIMLQGPSLPVISLRKFWQHIYTANLFSL
jgi:hypothetical protein